MYLNPSKIYANFRNRILDESSTVDSLIYLIENSSNEDLRLLSLNLISKLGCKSNNLCKFLENVLISDSNQSIRLAAFEALSIIRQAASENSPWAPHARACMIRDPGRTSLMR